MFINSANKYYIELFDEDITLDSSLTGGARRPRLSRGEAPQSPRQTGCSGPWQAARLTLRPDWLHSAPGPGDRPARRAARPLARPVNLIISHARLQ